MIRKDGLIDGTCGVTDTEAFETTFLETDDIVEGYPIIPTGFVSNKKVTLHKNEWKNILNTGDKMLNIHIPRRGKMPFDEIVKSLRDAIPFYKKHFPDEQCKAFLCGSWLLGNGLELLLDENSNIIKFQREFYLAPAKSDSGATKFFVFGKYDITGIEPKTTLEKNIVEFEKKGIYMYNGYGVILFEDADRYGSHFYRNSYLNAN